MKMRPIVPFRNEVHLTRTRHVSNEVMDAVHSGVSLMLQAACSDIKIIDLRDRGINTDTTGKSRFVDEYQKQAGLSSDHGCGPQFDAGRILQLARKNPLRNHNALEVMVVDVDLNSYRHELESPNSYIYGLAEPFFGCVISLRRVFDRVNPPVLSVDKQPLFKISKRISAHEFGHVLGLVSDRNKNRTFESDRGDHCAGERESCLMQQGLPLDLWIKRYLEEERPTEEICVDCQAELKTNLSALVRRPGEFTP
ncbi:MAG: hypothetical protein JW873_04685 [Candidatus Saganbacteria bacterium]|nr:hypothetical protein [Candidatus Saganbacteria bacterium]